jgi:hypothetical protein
MKNFNEQKEEIIKRAKAADACKGEFQRAVSAENIADLITVVKDNLRWCVVNKMLDAQVLEDIFGLELLKENHIYTQGVNEVRVTEGNAYIVTLGSSSANVETLGSSSANVETWDSSSANVETWDSSSANVKTWGSSSANVKTWDSSSANVETWDSSSANVKTWDSSSANVKTWGSSSANVKTWGSSSKLETKVEGSNSFIRNHNTRTISVKKDNFTIEIIE